MFDAISRNEANTPHPKSSDQDVPGRSRERIQTIDSPGTTIVEIPITFLNTYARIQSSSSDPLVRAGFDPRRICLIAWVALVVSCQLGESRPDFEQVVYELRTRSGSDVIRIFAVYEHSLSGTSTNQCGSRQDGEYHIWTCLLETYDGNTLRFLGVRESPSLSLIFPLDELGDPLTTEWSQWRRPAFLENSPRPDFRLLTGEDTSTRSFFIPEDVAEIRWRVRRSAGL